MEGSGFMGGWRDSGVGGRGVAERGAEGVTPEWRSGGCNSRRISTTSGVALANSAASARAKARESSPALTRARISRAKLLLERSMGEEERRTRGGGRRISHLPFKKRRHRLRKISSDRSSGKGALTRLEEERLLERDLGF